MKTIQSGVIKDALSLIAKVSDELFAWLGNDDTDMVEVKEVKKAKEKEESETFVFKVNLRQNPDGSKVGNYPYKIELELPKGAGKADTGSNIAEVQEKYADVPCKVTVWKNAEGENEYRTKEDVLGKDFWKTTRGMLMDMLDDDTKQAFGIKGARTMKVRLQRVCGAKETSINLSAITATYDLAEAYANLDSLLTSDEFADSITEDPVTLEITDAGSDYDIGPAEFALTEASSYGISQLICAAIQFQMDIQILRWYASYNSELFGITGNLWWEASSWTDKLGLWYIELTDSVFQVPQGCPSKPLELDDSSDTDPVYEIGLALADTVSAFLECIEGVYIDLPHDMQGELNSLIRSLKETRDMQLRRAM